MTEINPLTKDQLFEKKIAENTGSNYNVGDISDVVPVTKDQSLLKEIALNTTGQSGDIIELEGKVADNTSAIEAIVNVNGAKNWALLEPESESKDGITFTCTDGKSLTLSGTASDNTGKSYNLETPITGNVIVTLEQTANKVTLSYNDGTDWHPLPADGKVNGTIAQVGFNIVSGTVINETVYLMIRDARITDPTYVPYAMTNRELTERATKHSIVNRANFINAIGETVLSNALPSRDVVIHAFLVVYGGYYPTNDSGAWIVVQSPINDQDFVLELAEQHVDMAYASSTNIMTFNQTSGNADTVEIVIFRLY